MAVSELRDTVAENILHRSKFKLDANVQTLTGTLTLAADSPPLQALDPGGAGRDVLLPAEERGLVFVIVNTADAAEALTVKEDGGVTTIGTVAGSAGGATNERGIFVCDGTTWYALVGLA